jgi:hypothetical protein
MFVGVEPEAFALILEFYATDAEATDAAHSLPADGFDERTARLLARSGVLAEQVWERLPSEDAVARDAITAIGRVGLPPARPTGHLQSASFSSPLAPTRMYSATATTCREPSCAVTSPKAAPVPISTLRNNCHSQSNAYGSAKKKAPTTRHRSCSSTTSLPDG